MDLPKIDLATLPELDTLTGLFGSFARPAQALQSDDTLLVLMTFIYDTIKP